MLTVERSSRSHMATFQYHSEDEDGGRKLSTRGFA